MDSQAFEIAVKEAARARKAAQYDMDVSLNLHRKIDEVSILFETQRELNDFMAWAEGDDDGEVPRLIHFNSVVDTAVRQGKDEEEFKVRFEFLRVPGVDDWRIEAMCILSGEAPLHRLFLADHGSPAIVHASWKCQDRLEYEEDAAFLTSRRIWPRAEYQNTYGVFQYFGQGFNFFLKPRINLRDREAVTESRG